MTSSYNSSAEWYLCGEASDVVVHEAVKSPAQEAEAPNETHGQETAGPKQTSHIAA